MEGTGVNTTVISAGGGDTHEGRLGGLIRFFPGFVIVVVLYVVGAMVLKDPRAPLYVGKYYSFSWTEVLLLLACMIAIIELLRVSKAGIDNTTEAFAMLAVSIVQIVVYFVSVSDVQWAQLFRTTDFLMLTIISMTQSVVAFKINARTLKRTIDYGHG